MDPALCCCLLLLALVSTCEGRSQGPQNHHPTTRFTINKVTLTILPNAEVRSGTGVDLCCNADVSADSSASLIYKYNFFKDSTLMYTKSHSSASLTHRLEEARASNSGDYTCEVHIGTKSKLSTLVKLRVTGLQTPTLTLSTHNVTEGGQLTAECKAPKEQGPFQFVFYRNSTLVIKNVTKNNSARALVKFGEWGTYAVCCQYSLLFADLIASNISNKELVTVKELGIEPSIDFLPSPHVIEGDRLEIHCRAAGSLPKIEVYLSKGSKLLESGITETNWMTKHAHAEDSGEYQCKSEAASVEKTVSGTMNITELFSKPFFTMLPRDAYEGETITLSCRSDIISPQRIRKADVKYAFYMDNTVLQANSSGTFRMTAYTSSDGNYSCKAQAKSIQKTSSVYKWKTKVVVSEPLIGVRGRVVVKRPLQVTCQSKKGSLPITYTLKKLNKKLYNKTVHSPGDRAVFNVSIQFTREEIGQLACEAQNNGRNAVKVGPTLNVTVIEPVSKVELLALPSTGALVEGNNLELECSVRSGTSPFTFSWYHKDMLLTTKTTDSKRERHILQNVDQGQSGWYYCMASNAAEEHQNSKGISITVTLATWKFITIAAAIIVAIILVVTIFACCSTRRGKKKDATELSIKAPRSQSDASAAVALAHDATGYNKVGTDDMRRSVWSEVASDSDSDEQSSEDSGEKPTTVYAQVVLPESANNTRGAADYTDINTMEYDQLNHTDTEPV